MATQNYDVFEPTVWAPFIDVHFRRSLKAAKLFGNLSGNVTDGGDQIVVPKLDDNFSVNSVNTTSGDISPQNITDTATRIDIDQWNEASLDISDFQAAQIRNKPGVQREYATEIAHRLGRKVDTDFLGQADQYDVTLGDSATDLTVTNYQQAVEILASNSVPRNEAFALIHPRAYYGDLLNRSKIYDASIFGGATLRQGAVDNILGVDVMLHENIPTTNGALQNQMAHRKALAYGFGNLPVTQNSISGATVPSGVRLQEKPNPNLRITVVGDVMYGFKPWRTEAGIELLSQNDR